MQKKNYLNNKDILLEIHRSKNTYNSYVLPKYSDYHIIVDSLNDITKSVIVEAKINKAKQLTQKILEEEKLINKNARLVDVEVDPASISKQDLVFRVMTFDHIPDAPGRKKNPKTIADTKVRVNFPPFQHWKYNNDNELICVGKSHWEGDMDTGYFTKNKGNATNNLALMWLKLVERYATKSRVRGYSYNDEMQGQAIIQLTQIGLQFDESKSQNPFAYYTSAITNACFRVMNIEKRNQDIRDDLLEANGLAPSYTRIIDHEWELMNQREAKLRSKHESNSGH